MGEEFILTPENYEDFLKTNEIFSFDALRKPIFVRMFKAKEAIDILLEEKGVDGKNLVCKAEKGDIVARSQEGQIWAMKRNCLEEHYQALPLRENPDGTYTANWASRRK